MKLIVASTIREGRALAMDRGWPIDFSLIVTPYNYGTVLRGWNFKEEDILWDIPKYELPQAMLDIIRTTLTFTE